MRKKNADNSSGKENRVLQLRHRGRTSQIGIYFGKFLRMFIYQSDWKVLPMSAVIAGLVGLVIHNWMFVSMEGTLMAAFAMACVCIWNGCFNSIQAVCRERDVIKREHRSGMHVSSYIVAHMMYQFLICLMQTAITLYVTQLTGVKYPEKGLFTPWLIVDLGISMMFITYASDMLSLWVSTLAHSSTTAMTIMPFILIFQLVFSGAIITLPKWAEPISNFTISNPGLKVIAAHADLNHQPFVTISDMLVKMKDNGIEFEVTTDKLLKAIEAFGDGELTEIVEEVKKDPEYQELADDGVTLHTTVGKLLEVVGEEDVKTMINQKAAEASYDPAYENRREVIAGYWADLTLFILVFAALATISLEFIDKDKR